MQGFNLSPYQKRDWILNRSGNHLYNHLIININGQLNQEWLLQVWQQLVGSHEILRTRFQTMPSLLYPVQMIGDESPLEVVVKDLDHEKLVSEEIKKVISGRFDPEQGHYGGLYLLKVATGQHVLIIKLPSLLTDATSLKNIYNEFCTLYTTENKEQEEEPLQFTQFSEWQNDLLNDPDEEALAFWNRQKYKDLSSRKLVWEDRSGMAFKSTSPEVKKLDVDRDLSVKLEQYARQNEVSLPVLLQTAWAIAIWKYQDTPDTLAVGNVENERSYEEFENILGHLSKTLPMILELEKNQSVSQLMSQIANKGEELREWQDTFTWDAGENFDPEADQIPCFTAGFEFLHFEGSNTQKQGCCLQEIVSNSDLFKLKLFGLQKEAALDLSLYYLPTHLDEASITCISSQFVQLLQQVVAHPSDTPISELFVPGREETRLLASFNDTDAVYPDDSTLIDLFSLQVAATPDKVALVFEDRTYTFEQVDTLSGKLANLLKLRYGIKPGQVVILTGPASDEFIISMLGILKAGAVYLPVDSNIPSERLAFIAKDSEAKLLITPKSEFLMLNGLPEVFVFDKQQIEQERGNTEPTGITFSSDAYLIYTSGSTGKPKGVSISHESLINYITWFSNNYKISEEDQTSLFSSVAFDLSYTCIWASLLTGATLHVQEDAEYFDPQALITYLKNKDITYIKLTPSHLTLLLNSGHKEEISKLSLRLIVLGGEEIRMQDIEKYFEQNHKPVFVNEYGPTETTIGVIYEDITPENLDSYKNRPTIGKPTHNHHIFILDDEARLLPVGIAGEICIAGRGVARGYLNREELTREKFIDNPYTPEKYSKLYRTGDIGRWLPDGKIEYLGRNDNQVKINGHRAELEEITTVLLSYQDITDAVTIVRKDEEDLQELVAYVVTENDLDRNAVHAFLEKQLPAYLVPRYFVQMSRIPLTANGKVNKKALRAPEPNEMVSGAEYQAPSTEVEEVLTAKLEEILGRKNIGVNDTYFSLGGDSIKVIRYISFVNKTWNVSLAIKDVYEHQTVKAIAGLIEASKDTATDNLTEAAIREMEALKTSILENPELSKNLPDGWEEIYPMSDIEKGMIYHHQKSDTSGIYHDLDFVILDDDTFSYEAFRQAVYLQAAEHEILRASFHLAEFDQPVQIIHDVSSFELDIEYIDADQGSEEATRKYLRQFLRQDRANQLDPARPGLWRMRCLKLSGQSTGILWVTHHAIMDGWSNASFMTALSHLYYKLKEDINYQPEKLKASYKDYLVDQLKVKKSAEARAYWKEKLADYERTRLPLGKRVPEKAPDNITEIHTFDLEDTLSSGLEELAKQINMTVQHICFAAFCQLIKMTTNTSDITVGLVTHGRPEIEDGDRIFGCFVNTVPFRMKMPTGVTGGQLLKEAKSNIDELRAYEKMSLLEIMDITGEKTDDQNPIFDIAFGFVNPHIYDHLNKDLTAREFIVELSAEDNNFLFDFVVYKSQQGISVLIKVLAGIYQTHELETLSAYYISILNNLLEQNKVLTTATLLGDKGKEALLEHAYGVDSAEGFSTPFVSLFEEQVIASQDEVALSYYRGQMSYRELNEQANRLAHHIMANYDVEQGSIVGILAERSERQVVAMLAILKAGAAFLPLNPDNPVERLQYQLQDAGVSLLLTDSDYMFEAGNYYSGHLFALDIQLATLEESAENPHLDYNIADLAYVIYTSGSTGHPKGVEITLGNLANYLSWANNYYFNNEKGQYFGLFTPLYFDLSLTSIFSTLLRGDKLHIYTERDTNEILLEAFSEETDVNTIKMTPSHVSLLGLLDIEHTNVQTVILGGEALQRHHIEVLRKLNPEMKVYNEYGPTEATIGCVVKEITDADTITIGKPIANTGVFILNEDGELQPKGIPGELCISGAGVAKGYLNNESQTSARFTMAGFSEEERIYHTGDLARWLENGELEYLGRTDDQIKIRGYRIEPGEISHTIQQHEAVQDAYVHVTGEKEEDKALQAFITVNEEAYTIQQLLKAHNHNKAMLKSLYSLPNGMKVFHKNNSETDLIYFEIFEDHTYLKHGIEVKAGDVIFDIGANIGMFSLYMALNFQDVKLYAFEPLTPVYAMLEANSRLYKADIKTFNFGISNVDQEVEFMYYPNNTVLSGRYGNRAEEVENVRSYIRNQVDGTMSEEQIEEVLEERVNTQSINCRLRRLSDVIAEQQVEHIDLLKIDVEKSELDVIKGIDEKDWDKIKQVVIEVHEIDNMVEDIENTLRTHGFDVVKSQDDILKNTSIYNLYATKSKDRKETPVPIALEFNTAGRWTDPELFINHVSDFCKAVLPSYMVPADIQLIESLPLTANGKVNKKQLEQLAASGLLSSEEYVEPSSEVEKSIAAIWRKVLDKDQISIHADFFREGGNSLKATQVVSRMLKEMDVDLRLESIFRNPTIASLAEEVQAIQYVDSNDNDTSGAEDVERIVI